MKNQHKISYRFVATILLILFCLQSCYNQSIPLPRTAEEKKFNVKGIQELKVHTFNKRYLQVEESSASKNIEASSSLVILPTNGLTEEAKEGIMNGKFESSTSYKFSNSKSLEQINNASNVSTYVQKSSLNQKDIHKMEKAQPKHQLDAFIGKQTQVENKKKNKTLSFTEESFTIQGGHTVTFYNYKGQIYASVEIVDEKNKVFNCVPVRIKDGADLIGLLKTSKYMQKNRVCIRFAENKQPVEVVFYNLRGLLGGMKEGEKEEEELDNMNRPRPYNYISNESDEEQLGFIRELTEGDIQDIRDRAINNNSVDDQLILGQFYYMQWKNAERDEKKEDYFQQAIEWLKKVQGHQEYSGKEIASSLLGKLFQRTRANDLENPPTSITSTAIADDILQKEEDIPSHELIGDISGIIHKLEIELTTRIKEEANLEAIVLSLKKDKRALGRDLQQEEESMKALESQTDKLHNTVGKEQEAVHTLDLEKLKQRQEISESIKEIQNKVRELKKLIKKTIKEKKKVKTSILMLKKDVIIKQKELKDEYNEREIKQLNNSLAEKEVKIRFLENKVGELESEKLVLENKIKHKNQAKTLGSIRGTIEKATDTAIGSVAVFIDKPTSLPITIAALVAASISTLTFLSELLYKCIRQQPHKWKITKRLIGAFFYLAIKAILVIAAAEVIGGGIAQKITLVIIGGALMICYSFFETIKATIIQCKKRLKRKNKTK